jgi:hypothetical protein
MKHISVITAGNPGFWNTGMLTVELAFAELCREITPDAIVDWLVPYDGNLVKLRTRPYIDEEDLPFKSKVILGNNQKLLDSDLIVFWGDYLQARHYMTSEAAPRLVRAGVAANHQEAMAQLASILLLSGAPDHVIQKTIIVGSTILMNRQSDYQDPIYGPAFSRLIGHAKGVWMRDAISAAKVAQIRNGGINVAQGVDCALLLTDETIDSMRRTQWIEGCGDKDKIGIFMGGRTSIPPTLVIDFLRDISKQTGLELDWLPWFGFDYPSYVKATDFLVDPKGLINYRLNKKKMEDHMRDDQKYTAGDLLSALKRYKFIITDTYHVCVNSWRAGTPAICISSSKPLTSSEPEALSLTDFKKLVLYSMYDAFDYYVESDDLLDKRRSEKRVAVLLEMMSDRIVCDSIIERIKQHSTGVKTEISEQMLSILDIN